MLSKAIKIAATSLSSGLFIPIPPGFLNQETTQGVPSIERTVTVQYQELKGAWHNSVIHKYAGAGNCLIPKISATLQTHYFSLTNICSYCDLLVLVQSKSATTRSFQIYSWPVTVHLPTIFTDLTLMKGLHLRKSSLGNFTSPIGK